MPVKRISNMGVSHASQYPALVQSLMFKGFTASKAQDVTGRTFIHLKEMTEQEKANVAGRSVKLAD
ncbi:MAG: hypothetical protein ABSF09_12820 [Candidatus Bathyarchaeia archaeon]